MHKIYIEDKEMDGLGLPGQLPKGHHEVMELLEHQQRRGRRIFRQASEHAAHQVLHSKRRGGQNGVFPAQEASGAS